MSFSNGLGEMGLGEMGGHRAHSAPSGPLAGFKGYVLLLREGKGRGEQGRGRGKKGMEGRKGKARENNFS